MSWTGKRRRKYVALVVAPLGRADKRDDRALVNNKIEQNETKNKGREGTGRGSRESDRVE